MTQFVSMRNHRASTRLARPTRSGANLGIDIFKGPRLTHTGTRQYEFSCQRMGRAGAWLRNVAHCLSAKGC